MCPADHTGFVISYGIRGCISVTDTLKFTDFYLKEQCFVKNNRGTSLTGVAIDRISN